MRNAAHRTGAAALALLPSEWQKALAPHVEDSGRRMSLNWKIDPEARLITAIADGDVSRRDVETLLDEMASREAMTYRKLFDGSRGDTKMGPDDLLILGVRFRAFHAQGPMGPLAVVVPDDKAELVARVLGMLAAADRPMRVFRTPVPARRWLESLEKKQEAN
jgi:hypothetical protein